MYFFNIREVVIWEKEKKGYGVKIRILYLQKKKKNFLKELHELIELSFEYVVFMYFFSLRNINVRIWLHANKRGKIRFDNSYIYIIFVFFKCYVCYIDFDTDFFY